MTVSEAPAARPPERPKRRRSRVRVAIGVVLILIGLGLLAYVAWQYWGTNVVSKQKQAEERRIIQKDWSNGIETDAVGLLRVPRFGESYEQPIVRGFDDDALSRGVGWDTKTAKPGEVGNFAIAAHRVTHGEPFAKFPELQVGDRIIIETRRYVYVYKLRNDGTSIIVPFTVSWPLWPVPDPDARDKKPTEKLITMLTCSELFHTDNRSVAIGELVKTVDKSDPRATADR